MERSGRTLLPVTYPLMNRRPISFRPLLASLLLLSMTAAWATFDFGGNTLVMEQFRTRGSSTDGKGTWMLEGSQARLDGPAIHLANAKLTYTDANGETTIITSPVASFNRAERRGHSDAPLRVENNQATVTGVGYDLLADQHKLFIRSHVHMTFKHRGDSPLEQAVKKQLTPEIPVEGKQP